MPTREELLEAIKELQSKEPTYATCEKLSTFYSLLGYLYPQDAGYSYEARNVIPNIEGTEFQEVISGKPIELVMDILNEHMEVVKVLFPKEYMAVMQRLDAIK